MGGKDELDIQKVQSGNEHGACFFRCDRLFCHIFADEQQTETCRPVMLRRGSPVGRTDLVRVRRRLHGFRCLPVRRYIVSKLLADHRAGRRLRPSKDGNSRLPLRSRLHRQRQGRIPFLRLQVASYGTADTSLSPKEGGRTGATRPGRPQLTVFPDLLWRR